MLNLPVSLHFWTISTKLSHDNADSRSAARPGRRRWRSLWERTAVQPGSICLGCCNDQICLVPDVLPGATGACGRQLTAASCPTASPLVFCPGHWPETRRTLPPSTLPLQPVRQPSPGRCFVLAAERAAPAMENEPRWATSYWLVEVSVPCFSTHPATSTPGHGRSPAVCAGCRRSPIGGLTLLSPVVQFLGSITPAPNGSTPCSEPRP